MSASLCEDVPFRQASSLALWCRPLPPPRKGLPYDSASPVRGMVSGPALVLPVTPVGTSIEARWCVRGFRLPAPPPPPPPPPRRPPPGRPLHGRWKVTWGREQCEFFTDFTFGAVDVNKVDVNVKCYCRRQLSNKNQWVGMKKWTKR